MADQKCPCKQEFTNDEKNLVEYGLNNVGSLIKNPHDATIGKANDAHTKNKGIIDRLDSITSALPSTDALAKINPQIKNFKSKLDSYKTSIDSFKAECDKLKNVNNLAQVLSNLSLYGDINCALGRPGLNISAGLNVVNENGQLHITNAANLGVNITDFLQSFDVENLKESDALKLSGGLDSFTEKITDSTSKLDDTVRTTQSMQNTAQSFTNNYSAVTTISGMMGDGINDPCYKLGAIVNGGMANPAFLGLVQKAIDSSGSTGGTR